MWFLFSDLRHSPPTAPVLGRVVIGLIWASELERMTA